MSDIGDVGYTVSVTLNGIKEAESQLKALREQGKSLEKISGSVDLEIGTVDASKARAEIKKSGKEFGIALTKEMERSLDFSFVDKLVSEGFKKADISGIVAPIQAHADATKKSCQAVASDVAKTVSAIDSELRKIEKGNYKPGAALDAMNASVDALRANVASMYREGASQMQAYGAAITQLQTKMADMVRTSLTGKTLVAPPVITPTTTGDMGKQLESALAGSTALAAEQKKAKEAIDATADATKKLADVSSGLGAAITGSTGKASDAIQENITKPMQAVESAAESAKEAVDTAADAFRNYADAVDSAAFKEIVETLSDTNTRLVSLEHTAAGLQGRFKQMFAGVGQVALAEVREIERSLSGMDIGEAAFERMFGIKATTKVKEVTAALQEIRSIKGELSATSGGEDAGEDGRTVAQVELVNRLRTAMNELSRVRERHTSTLIADNNAMREAAAAGNFGIAPRDISAADTITASIEKSKQSIIEVMTLMGRRADALRDIATLEQSVVNVAKSGGDVEAAQLNVLLKKEKMYEALLRTSESLLRTEKELSALPDTARLRGARKSLLQGASDAAQMSVMSAGTSSEAQAGLDALNRAGTALSAHNARDGFRQAVMEATNAIASGLAPNVDKLLSSLERYKALSSSAFKGQNGDIELANHLLDGLTSKLNAVGNTRTASSRKESAKLLDTISSVAGTVGGATDNSGAAANLSAMANMATKSADALRQDELRLQANERMTSELAKHLLLLKSGVDIIGDHTRLQQLYVQSIKEGIPIETAIARAVSDKKAVFTDTYNKYLSLNAAAREHSHDLATQKMLYEAALIPLKQAAAIQKTMGQAVQVGDKSITADTLQGHLLDNASSLGTIDKEAAAKGRLNTLESGYVELTRQRLKAEADIVDVLARNLEIVNAGTMGAKQYASYVDAIISANVQGVDTAEHQKQLEEARLQAIRRTLDELTRAGNISRQAAGDTFLTIKATESEIKALTEMAQVLGGRGAAIGKVRVDPDDIDKRLRDKKAALDLMTGKAKVEPTAPPPTSMGDIVSLDSTSAKSLELQAATRSRITDEIKKTHQELLSGVNVLKNYERMQQLIVQASEQGVQIESRHMSVLLNKERVMDSLLGTARSVAASGVDGGHSGLASVAYKSANEYLDAAKVIAGDNKTLIDKINTLNPLVDSLRELAGSNIKGSMAERQAASAGVSERMREVFGQGATVASASVFASREVMIATATKEQLGAQLPLLREQLKIQEDITRTQQFRDASATEQRRHLSEMAALKEELKLMEQAERLRSKLTMLRGKLGLEEADAIGPGARKNLINATKKTSQFGAFIEYNAASRELGVVDSQLANIAQKSNRLGKSTSDYVSLLREAAKASEKVADSTQSKVKWATAEQGNQAGQDMFDMPRMLWFAQLRMFWASFTNMQQITQQAIEFAHTLNVIQAVAQTTTQDIANINSEFDRMSRVIPKAYAELAQATLQVAKAGFSAEEALRVVESSARLAQATGDSVAKVADVQTVVMHAWGTGADKSEELADKLFNAVAKSRADIEGLSSALGYVAGIAPQANIPIEQVLAMMSILSNAGLSMSKAGTYMRQFLNDLMNPSAKLMGVLDKLGVSASEVDPRMNKLSDILKKLGGAGMNVTDAFEGMSLRAASAFSILLKQPELLDEFTQAIEKSGSVASAFGIATDDFRSRADLFQNSLQQTANSMGGLLSPVVGGMLGIMASLLNGVSDLAKDGGSSVRAFSGQFVVAMLSIGTIVMATIKILRMLQSSMAVTAAFPLLTRLPLAMGGIGLVATAIMSLGAVAYSVFKDKYPSSVDAAIQANERMKESMDELRKASDAQQGMRMEITDARSSVAEINSLRNSIKGVGTPGERSVAGDAVEHIGRVLRGMKDPDVVEWGAEVINELRITPDMDISEIEGKLTRLDDIIQKVVKHLQESLVGTLEKSMSAATEIQKEALAQLPSRIEKLQEYAEDSSSRKVRHVVARGVAPRKVVPAAEELKNELRSRVKGARNEGGFFDFDVDNVGDSRAKLTKQVDVTKDLLTTHGIDTKKLDDAMAAPGTLDDKREAFAASLEFYIADLDKFTGALGDSGAGAVTAAKTVVDALRTALSSGTGTPEGVKLVKDALEATKEIDKIFAGLGVSKDSVTPLGAVFRDLIKLREGATKAIKQQESDTERNAKAVKQGVSPDMGEGNAHAVAGMMDSLVKDVNEYHLVTKKLTDSVDLNELYPSPETYNSASEALHELTTNLGILSEKYTIFKQNNPGKDLPVEQLKKYVEMADKAFAAAYKLRTRSVAGETSVESAVAAAKDTNGEDYQGVLRRSDVGKQISESLKGLGGVNEEDTIDTIIFKTREMQTVITQFVQEGAFKKFHSEAATSLRKHRQSWREFRDDVRDSIDASTTALVAFQSVVEGLLGTRQFLVNLDANSVAMAGAADKTNKYRSELRKLKQEQKEVARVAGNAASYLREQGTDKFTIGGIMELNKFSTVASQKLESMRSSLEGVTGEMITLTSQIVKMNAEISRSKLDFKQQVANLDAGQMLNENQMFVFKQQQLNETRDFARQSAKTASPEDAVGILTELRNQLIEYAGQYYDTPTGRSARNEAIGIQDDIIKLQEFMKSQLEAELAIRKHYQDTMMDATLGIRTILQTVSDQLASAYTKGAGVPAPQVARVEDRQSPVRSTLNPRNFGPLAGDFDLAKRFESRSSMKAIGYDTDGGMSYGAIQFASKQGTMDRFMEFMGSAASDIKQYMEAKVQETSPRNADGSKIAYTDKMWQARGNSQLPKDAPGAQAWVATVDKFGERFEKLYMQFTDANYGSGTIGNLRNVGFDPEKFSQTLRSVYASTSIQHGPNMNKGRTGAPAIFEDARKRSNGADVNSPEFINAVYAERARRKPSTSSRYTEENSLAQDYLMKELGGLKEAVRAGAAEGIAQGAGQLTLPTASPTPPGTSAVATAVTELATASSVAAPSVQGLNEAVTGTGEGALATAEQLDSFKSGVGVADKATIELAEAHAQLTEETNAAKDAILSEAGAKRQVTDIEEYLMPRETLKKYAARTRNFNAYTQETFNGLADSVQGGLTSAIVGAMKTVGTEDSWYDAANEALEAMTWKMVEIWVDWQTRLFMDGVMGSMAGTPNAFDSFNTSWGFGAGENAAGITEQQDPTGMTQGATGLVTDVSATSDAATKLAENAAADMSNIVMDSANLAQESALLATEQTTQITDGTNATTLGTAASGLSTAGTSLSTAASQLSSAASSMAASSSSSGASSGAGSLLGGAASMANPTSSAAGSFGMPMKNGGVLIPGYASGGRLESGNRQADSALYVGQKGEYIVREPVVNKYGKEFFDRINGGDAQYAFDSLVSPTFDSGAVSTTVHKEASTSRKVVESGQGGGRGGSSPLSILNLQDPGLVGQYMNTPAGKRVVTNIVGSSIKKFVKK